ncbi:26975_t:CDS:2 [Dentiscutata erythropus]|uniref:26975_t:CDS:1 n=1 Tax=Dentiscutata erythropus TaxID=1348616 RepID=A0A9N9HWJ4_9GLOM|nr:26975_t:CDS:2 [Dentiscutata erythropus]
MTFENLSNKTNDPFKGLLKDKSIDYNAFKNTQLIGSGTFGSTYHAVYSNNILVHEDNIKIAGIRLSGRLSDVFNLSNKFPKFFPYINPQCFQHKEQCKRKFIEGTPIPYAIIYTDCWLKDPNIQEIAYSFEWLKAELIHSGNGL